jgi:hypothetical protein
MREKSIYLRQSTFFVTYTNTDPNIVFLVSLSRVLLLYWLRKSEYPRKTAHLKNIITWCCIEYTPPWVKFKLTAIAVIVTDCICSCKSNYHAITWRLMTVPIWFKISLINKEAYIVLIKLLLSNYREGTGSMS